MGRFSIFIAFIISIIIHLILFISYEDKKIEETKKKEEKKKTELTFVKLKKKEPVKPKTEKKPIKKPEAKKQELKKKKPKKVVKKKTPVKKVKPKKVVKKTKPSNKKPKKVVKKKTPIKKVRPKKIVKKPKKEPLHNKILKEQIVNKKTSIQQKTLEDFLSQKNPVDNKTLSAIERLYGREFQSFTKVQKAFIKKNLNQFQVITQRVLDRMGYPPLAAQLKLGGTNVVEFMFYPNGDIKRLKITSSSGYKVLDNYSLELIEIAYKDYPRPKTPTKLKFYVNYRLY